ncbi:DUF2510 domain-containing protein [Subtercola endophyticus]|uniref:DUF2510 domain-containing protein n=1 Tax=Subtercola endophyticus TaxID=2895559 RepID=UPI001E51800C|nr:DUF2510 domain-containing protein [Subtercola endophyticus]UFS59457.1 DUF2510 domain-containing protein [Subtercola endophyticus]
MAWSAGWYPEEGGGERYWDGNGWTQATRGPGVPPAPKPRFKWWYAPIIIFGLIGLAFGAAWIVGQSHHTTATAPLAAAPNIPTGFTDMGGGVAIEWDNNPDCSYYTACVELTAYAYQDCSNGLYIEANVLDSDKTIVDTTNDLVSSVPEGQKAKSVLGWMNAAGTGVHVTKINCY